MTDFTPIPTLPREIIDAAQSGELVLFIGAGVSKLISCPSWHEFANCVLGKLVPDHIDHYALQQLKTIADPRKRLSLAKIIAEKRNATIDYASIFEVDLPPNNIYSLLNALECPFVTTNYDLYLKPECNRTRAVESWRFFRREQLLGANLDQRGNVVHLHGCVSDSKNMVITTKDYLDHYSSKEVQTFLQYLFEKKTVLFMGYGLEEIEVLEYILRKGSTPEGDQDRFKRFILQGFFQADSPLFILLQEYYRTSFRSDLIPFPKEQRSYEQLIEIIAEWAKALAYKPMELTDEVAALEAEING